MYLPRRGRHDREVKTVGDVMHRGVIGCRPEASLVAVARTMAAHRIHCVAVAGHGVITDAELVAALDRSPETTAAKIARTAPHLDETATLEQAAETLREQRSTHALVVRQGSQVVVGVLSALDLAEALAA
jgi:predicted transcriptional regulator